MRHAVGDRVIRKFEIYEEKGIIVAVWDGHDGRGQDCYVALYGMSWPEKGKIPYEMYVGRYLATSLTPALDHE